jgi:hypothetical protein
LFTLTQPDPDLVAFEAVAHITNEDWQINANKLGISFAIETPD